MSVGPNRTDTPQVVLHDEHLRVARVTRVTVHIDTLTGQQQTIATLSQERADAQTDPSPTGR